PINSSSTSRASGAHTRNSTPPRRTVAPSRGKAGGWVTVPSGEGNTPPLAPLHPHGWGGESIVHGRHAVSDRTEERDRFSRHHPSPGPPAADHPLPRAGEGCDR